MLGNVLEKDPVLRFVHARWLLADHDTEGLDARLGAGSPGAGLGKKGGQIPSCDVQAVAPRQRFITYVRREEVVRRREKWPTYSRSIPWVNPSPIF